MNPKRLPPHYNGRSLFKSLLLLKLSFAIIFATSLQVSAKGFSHTKLTINMQQTSVSKILEAIEKKTSYKFVYLNNYFLSDYKVSVNVKETAVETILLSVLGKSGFTFKIIDENTIAIIKTAKEERISVHGKVTTEQGDALQGVTVSVDEPNATVITNSKGEYNITADENATATFSFVGYETQIVPVNGRTQINISLKESISNLADVVVIGYGSVKKTDLTGSVASISAKDITRVPSTNLISAIEGEVSGVNIIQATGDPGSIGIIRIRGANSISPGANDPLYVVDGLLLSTLGNNFSLNDVQSMQVLKDASATAIYGSRGANGVVIITTKRGITGKTEFSYDSYAGVQKIIKKLNFLNATEYKKYYLEAKMNATVSTAIDTSITNSTANTDWLNEVYRPALIQNHTISIRGGTSLLKYYTSVNYFQQEGVIRNTDFTRLSFRFNSDLNLSDRLQLSNNLLLSLSDTHGVFGDESVSNGVAWARPTQPVLDANGNPTFISVPFPRTNPLSLVNDVVNQNIGYRVVGNILLDYKIFKGLFFKINLGTEDNIGVSNNYIPNNLYESSYMGSGSRGYGTSISWLNENTFNYAVQLNKNNSINAVAGVSFQDTKADGLTGTSTGYVINGFQYNNLGAGSTQTVSSSFSEYSLLSYLGRVNYSYKDKWLLTASGRYDGSSKLAEGHKYAFFPSGALAWRMSQENFLKNSKTISELKLRGSLGKTGSQSVAPYSSFAQLSTTSVYLNGTSPTIGYVPSAVANQNLTWETTTQADIGVDLGLFNNRIQFTGDVYRKHTKGLLFSRLTPPSSGYTTSTQNIGEVENKGLELSVTSNNLVGVFNWTTIFNISFNRAKVLDLGTNPSGGKVTMIQTDAGLSYFPLILGQVPFSAYGYLVDHRDLTTGQYFFKDLNKDSVVDSKDQTVFANFQPKYIFGFTNDFTYKNFDLSIFIQGSQGNKVFSSAYQAMLTLNGQNNILKSVYDGIGTKYPIPNADNITYPPLNNSLIFDGSYIRFKTITLGYSLPVSLLKKTHLQGIRIYVSGTNLITIDHYPWYDPEVSAGTDVLTGWDNGGYANNKSIIGGIKVNF
jgi:TonB-dependent starch-binding outer membrane protein SusC